MDKQIEQSGILEQLGKLLELLKQGQEIAGRIVGTTVQEGIYKKAEDTPGAKIDEATWQLKRAINEAYLLTEQMRRIESKF